MEKKLNVKKEVFESLRLELQEFTPQEFVATCYTITFTCQSLGWIRNGAVNAQEHDSGDITTFKMSYDMAPSFVQALNEWGRRTNTSIYNNARTSSKSNQLGNSQHSRGGYSWKDDDEWHIITDQSSGYSYSEDLNVSG